MRFRHDLNEIHQTCTCVLWLDQGRVVAVGDVETVRAGYGSAATIP
jgi:ABC-type polysaccharide/polyol phosphate transport system ATPase subunit